MAAPDVRSIADDFDARAPGYARDDWHRQLAVRMVTCAAGLLYMPVADALREWYRVLTAGGRVVFSSVRRLNDVERDALHERYLAAIAREAAAAPDNLCNADVLYAVGRRLS